MWSVLFGVLSAGLAAFAIGRAVLSAPSSSALRLEGSPAPSPLDDATRAQFAAFVPSADAVVGPPPTIPADELLPGMAPLPPPAVDLSLAGVADDREGAEREIWRAVRKTLAARAGGGRAS